VSEKKERKPPRPVCGAETREKILDAAEALFAEHGFEGASMRMITARAGVNLAAVNYHFGSKENLLREIFRRRLAEITEERRRRLAQLQRLCKNAFGALALNRIQVALALAQQARVAVEGPPAPGLHGEAESCDHW